MAERDDLEALLRHRYGNPPWYEHALSWGLGTWFLVNLVLILGTITTLLPYAPWMTYSLGGQALVMLGAAIYGLLVK